MTAALARLLRWLAHRLTGPAVYFPAAVAVKPYPDGVRVLYVLDDAGRVRVGIALTAEATDWMRGVFMDPQRN